MGDSHVQEPALGDSWTEEERDRLGLKKRATGLREPGDRPGCVSWMLQIVLYDGTWSHIETVKLPPSATVDDLISGAQGSLGLYEKSSLVVTTSPGWLAAMQDALPRETKLGDIDMPPLELPDYLSLFRGRKFLFLHEPPLPPDVVSDVIGIVATALWDAYKYLAPSKQPVDDQLHERVEGAHADERADPVTKSRPAPVRQRAAAYA